MKCHSDLASLNLSIVLNLDRFSVSTLPGKKVFLCFTVHTVHKVIFYFIFISLACECSVNSEHFTVHRYRLIDANVIVCCERGVDVRNSVDMDLANNAVCQSTANRSHCNQPKPEWYKAPKRFFVTPDLDYRDAESLAITSLVQL